ncbi:inositol monophosphatase [candidate division KSB1 bacterium]|nr:inositol monophosphatase [candidate division KSB1 bacterium]
MDHILNTAIEAARKGGRILCDGFGTLQSSQVSLKGAGDYVTDCDHASEKAIIALLRDNFPDHTIHAEESGSDLIKSNSEWFIDPLDGTANFVQGIPVFAVSLAWVQDGQIQIGVVYDPMRDELFHAMKGQGAWLNGQLIHVSGKTDLSTAMLATGFPWRSKSYLDDYLESFKVLFQAVAGMRRLGTAALDLAYTACGRFDGFWEMKLKPWDIGAGIIMVQEAGGIVSDFSGDAGFFESGNMVAGSPAIHAKMSEITRKILSRIK